MDPVDRLRRARALFDRVIELDRTERSAAIREGSGGDDELVELVERLCALDDRADFTASVSTSRIAHGLVDAVLSDARRPLTEGSRVGPLDPGAPEPSLEIRGRLGQGGVAAVYQVFDHTLGCTCALKVLEVDPEHGPMDLVEGFVREAQITAQLVHPAVPAVHRLGLLEDGRLYFVMEEVRGASFESLVRRVHGASPVLWSATHDGWTLVRLVSVLHRVCEAIAFAHSRGVVHRDLKPEHIVVSDFGRVSVMDWGIAWVEADGGSGVRIAGTPGYMAPEQARPGSAVTPRTDVYALGALLFFLLVGEPPVSGSSVEERLARVSSGQRQELIERPGGPVLPWQLVAIAEHALSADPSERPAHAGELAETLGHWLERAHRHEDAATATLDAEASRDALRLQWRALREQASDENRIRARLAERRFERELQAALARAPDLDAVRHVLVLHHLQCAARASASVEREVALREAEATLRDLDAGWPGLARLRQRLQHMRDARIGS